MDNYDFKIPTEDKQYPQWSEFAIEQISGILDAAIAADEHKIFINTNLRRGLPLENINKVAGPFIEAWALEKFEGILVDPENQYCLIHVEAGRVWMLTILFYNSNVFQIKRKL